MCRGVALRPWLCVRGMVALAMQGGGEGSAAAEAEKERRKRREGLLKAAVRQPQREEAAERH